MIEKAMPETVRELINKGRDELELAGVDSPEFDSKVLCSFVMGVSLSELSRHYRDSIEEMEKLISEEGGRGRTGIKERFTAFIERRAAHEPLQYITNEQDFMGFTFKTDERGLIPRLDTEILTQEAFETLGRIAGSKCNGPVKALDLCCGTGAIGISLAKLWKDAGFPERGQALEMTLSDIDDRVLGLAKENAIRLSAENDVRLEESDLFSQIPVRDLDLIVSNPPYIPTDVIQVLQKEVKDHEPMAALDGGEDGLVLYRRIIKEAPSYLAEGGEMLLEIGFDQAEAVTEMIRGSGCFDDKETEVVKDLAGLDRVVRCKYNQG